MRTTEKYKNGIHITVTSMNEPSEEAILEFRKAITKIIRESGISLQEWKERKKGN